MFESIKYFFRGIEDGMPFEFFSFPHLLAILILFSGAVWIIKNQKRLSQSKEGPILIKSIAVFLLITQLLKYFWDIASGHFNLDIGLPLYPCRIAIWLLLLSTLFKRKSTWPLAFVWGLLGSIVATIIADPYPFVWPHYTNLEFFTTHIGMGWLILLQIVIYKPRFEKQQIRALISQTNIFLLLSWLCNVVLNFHGYDVNYAYLFAPPEFLSAVIPAGLPFTLLMVVAYNLFVSAMFLLGKAVTTKYYALERA
ncbi:MAG: TIGR02206 family membrane protein [Eubacteriales bacterium]|nr:TIGR02206 family membrane protein [Eubacteriales bacterium]